MTAMLAREESEHRSGRREYHLARRLADESKQTRPEVALGMDDFEAPLCNASLQDLAAEATTNGGTWQAGPRRSLP